jgi:hypothetical protein
VIARNLQAILFGGFFFGEVQERLERRARKTRLLCRQETVVAD